MTTDSDEPGLLPQVVDFTLSGYSPPYIDKVCCVFDNGLFPELAVALVGQFKHVYYYSSWEQSFPRSSAMLIGKGIEGVERIDSIWPHIDNIDVFAFADILHGPLQVYLRSIGKPVWGSGLAESLELHRAASKRWLRDLGLPVGPYRALHGMTELRRHLQSHDDQYVKISRSRGDMETFNSKSYELIQPRLDELEHALGPQRDLTEFVVEEPIKAKAEVGYDGFTVDGRWPRYSLFGVEAKDQGYVGQVVPYSGMPRSLGYVNQKLAPLFKDLSYRGFFSSEIRVAEDNTPYLIDPCCRMASPPGELYLYLITNLAEVIWGGANGDLVDPKWRYEWGAQLVLHSDWAEHGWQPIRFDPALREHVKLHYLTVIDGQHYYVPQDVKFPEIGSVVAGGHTKAEAIGNVNKIAEQVEGYDVSFNIQALEDAAADMEKLKAA
jgi:hypothetical protein